MSQITAIEAQAELHHQYFLGLQLMVASQESPKIIYEWMFRLFRRQHEEKFLSSFEKLGLSDLSPAIACAKYHVLSNNIGGVGVEYMEGSATKAWVRFRYPRWMYAGPAICGIPVEASRGFLHGWYAQNGVSLKNPRLGFVCVSEDMTGQFGLCGYFKEYAYDLTADQRLQFAPEERPPAYDPSAQPVPPAQAWTAERLARAKRNYALEYVRNGLITLADVLGRDRTLELGRHAARLSGLQHFRTTADQLGYAEGGAADTAQFLADVLSGMGDSCQVHSSHQGSYQVCQSGLRIVRGLGGRERADVLACWIELWRGLVQAQRCFMSVTATEREDQLIWQIT